MKRITLALLSLTFVATLVGAAQDDAQHNYGRNFVLNQVDPRVAEAWFWELCEELANGATCFVAEVAPGEDTMLAVRAPSGVHAAFARRLAERDTGRLTQEFQLLLVEASKDSEGMDQELPPHARAALQDVREFLPFSRFDLLDSGWIKSSGRGQVDLGGGATRYEAHLVFDPKIELDGVVLAIQNLEVQVRYSTDSGERVRNLIRSSLTMKVGETAVVGTSKLNGGDKAVIVLLTALD